MFSDQRMDSEIQTPIIKSFIVITDKNEFNGSHKRLLNWDKISLNMKSLFFLNKKSLVRDRMQDQLRRSLQETLDRCLHHTSSWLAHLLCSLPVQSDSRDRSPREQEKSFSPHLEFSKSLFLLKEYMRAWDVLEKERSKGATETKAQQFLRLYAYYMAGEKLKQERDETTWHSSAAKKLGAKNPHLQAIHEELCQNWETLDTYLSFLYGIVCQALNLESIAETAFIQAATLNPWNLGAWQALTNFVQSAEKINKIIARMPIDNVMVNLFKILSATESDMYPYDEIIPLLETIEAMFPNNTWIQTQKALIYYVNCDYDAAEDIFRDIQREDPYNIDSADTFSNILFVKENSAELSVLAKTVYKIDRYRAESCCVVGNMYALKLDHGKAISYFLRSLKLNPHFLTAWILLGHEYLGSNSLNAAVQSYRRALEISPKDYRAWYGLGHTYDLLQMPQYAIFYLHKAAALKPYNDRIWETLGGIYRDLKNPSNAIDCFKRSIAVSEVANPTVIAAIAKLYAETNQKQAVQWFQLFMDQDSRSDEDSEAAHIYLAQYYMAQRDFAKTNKYLGEVLHTEEGKVIQRELKSLEKNRNFDTLGTAWL